MPVTRYVLTPSEAKVLAGIPAAVGIPFAQMSAEARLAPAELTKIVRSLNDKGLVVLREPDAARGRYYRVLKVTDTGVRIQELMPTQRPRKRRLYTRLWTGPSYILRRRMPKEQVLILPSDDDAKGGDQTADQLDQAIKQVLRKSAEVV